MFATRTAIFQIYPPISARRLREPGSRSSSAIASRYRLFASPTARERRSQSNRPFPQLTQREYDILDLIATGLDNASIAQQCYVHPKTVRNHVSNIFAKIHVRDRSAAIVLARQNGLGNGKAEPK